MSWRSCRDDTMTKSSTDSPSLPCPSTSGSAKVDLLCAPVNDAVLPSSILSLTDMCMCHARYGQYVLKIIMLLNVYSCDVGKIQYKSPPINTPQCSLSLPEKISCHCLARARKASSAEAGSSERSKDQLSTQGTEGSTSSRMHGGRHAGSACCETRKQTRTHTHQQICETRQRRHMRTAQKKNKFLTALGRHSRKTDLAAWPSCLLSGLPRR